MSDEAVRRAQDAARLLDDATLVKAFADLHAVYVTEWRSADTTEARERLWHRDAALSAVETELRKAIEHGSFETTQQDRRIKRGHTIDRRD